MGVDKPVCKSRSGLSCSSTYALTSVKADSFSTDPLSIVNKAAFNSLDLEVGASSTKLLNRYQELHEIVIRLTAENKQLRQQLEEAQEEILTRSLEEGRFLLKFSDKSWASETDNCTREEVTCVRIFNYYV
ncbi:unnamed protein product [Protopolystoma xenopodis]|uniref:CorA-like transporter domain-containing protein n=1 Tax=Protopolystoma xenopodis TaxID=117903 RepID=A0A448X0N0_9PLAT|nr:unnamed protein product [Protopolystoma xenopodis]